MFPKNEQQQDLLLSIQHTNNARCMHVYPVPHGCLLPVQELGKESPDDVRSRPTCAAPPKGGTTPARWPVAATAAATSTSTSIATQECVRRSSGSPRFRRRHVLGNGQPVPHGPLLLHNT